jgi:hypothetical protein
MPGLVPGIHVLELSAKKGVDGRVEPGHDDGVGIDPIIAMTAIQLHVIPL